ncbi:MAG: hypothetical protein J1D77_04065 [Muribaculaceae bacterium]|nr:hypothetical protein [Muribaculaceae bacterium]
MKKSDNKIKDKIIFIWKAHITNWLWRDRQTRRNARYMAFGEKKLKYLSKYTPFIKSLKPESEIQPVDPDKELFFSLWLQGYDSAPPIVKKCIASMKRMFGDRFILLEEKDIEKFIDLPSFVVEKWRNKQMIPAHFSDIVRIELLHKFGGYWLDATDFVYQPIPKEISETDFFMFVASPKHLIHTCVQNYFIRAKLGDPLLDMWRKVVLKYWETEDSANSYFLVQFLFKLLVTENPYAGEMFAKMPKIELDNAQLLWHEIGNLPYSPALEEELLARSFFQKCSYKGHTGIIRDIRPGSITDFLINGKGSDQ